MHCTNQANSPKRIRNLDSCACVSVYEPHRRESCVQRDAKLSRAYSAVGRDWIRSVDKGVEPSLPNPLLRGPPRVTTLPSTPSR